MIIEKKWMELDHTLKLLGASDGLTGAALLHCITCDKWWPILDVVGVPTHRLTDRCVSLHGIYTKRRLPS